MDKDSKEVLLDLGLKDKELVVLMDHHFKYIQLYQVFKGSPETTLKSIITLLEGSAEDYVVDLIQELDDHISAFTSVANKIINRAAKEIINLIKIRFVLFILFDRLLGLYDLSFQGVTGKDNPVLYIGNPVASVADFYQYQFILRAYEQEFMFSITPTSSGTANTTSIDKIKDLEVKIHIDNLTRPNKTTTWYTHIGQLKNFIDRVFTYIK